MHLSVYMGWVLAICYIYSKKKERKNTMVVSGSRTTDHSPHASSNRCKHTENQQSPDVLTIPDPLLFPFFFVSLIFKMSLSTWKKYLTSDY